MLPPDPNLTDVRRWIQTYRGAPPHDHLPNLSFTPARMQVGEKVDLDAYDVYKMQVRSNTPKSTSEWKRSIHRQMRASSSVHNPFSYSVLRVCYRVCYPFFRFPDFCMTPLAA